MKKILLISVVVALLALDWAALHDIIKGEPNPHLEYGMIAFSIVIFGLVALIFLKKRR